MYINSYYYYALELGTIQLGNVSDDAQHLMI